MIGTMLGRYHILEELGAGGMGVVYRARDRSLGREVAVKVLPAAFSADPERMGRFQREAKVLASLNHPNIAAIHSLEEENGVNFLVLELVPGATLSDLIRKGQLSLERALELCSQIAGALEAAHEQGIIHRDLKPANVKVTADGKAKVLDFGLAKATGLEGGDTAETRSTTITAPGTTMAGAILGTAAYMSPEQARGLPLDRRTDIWSFGCVLYESLSGHQTFEGRTVSDCIANIIRGEPEWSHLPPETPTLVRDLLRRCLVKDPHHRLRDIGDARILINEAVAEKSWIAPPPGTGMASDGTVPIAPKRGNPALRFLPWAVAVLALAAAGFAWFNRSPASAGRSTPVVQRADIVVPPAPPTLWPSRGLAISRSGEWLVFPVDEGTNVRLYRRSLLTSEVSPIPGTEGVVDFSLQETGQGASNPARTQVAFTALPDRQLRTVNLEGGDARVLVEEPVRTGFSGDPEGSIFFRLDEDQSGGHLWRAEGGRVSRGDPQILTGPDLQRGEVELTWPRMLPDGQNLLVTVRTKAGFQVAVHSLVTGQRTTLVENGSSAVWADDAVLYLEGRRLMALPVDPSTLEPTGPARLVAENVATSDGGAHGLFDVASNGLLVYMDPGALSGATTRPGYATRGGAERVSLPLEGTWLTPRIDQPEGTIALSGWSGEGFSVGILDEKLEYQPLSGSSSTACGPVWGPNGRRIVFSSRESGSWDIFRVSAFADEAPRSLVAGATQDMAEDWSRDGNYLLFTRYASASAAAGGDIWILPMFGDPVPEPLLATPAGESSARFSPNGRWIAYVSDDTGRREVYARPFPASDRRYPVSAGGGTEPLWSPDGTRIFYRNGDRILSASVAEQGGSLDVRAGGEVAREDLASPAGAAGSFDVLPDGNRFLVIRGTPELRTGTTTVRLVLDWRSTSGMDDASRR